MNTSIVIPLGNGSRNNDLELRYCLRSIEKHVTGYGDIVIIGEKPSWLKNVVHISCPDYGDKTYDKERNIFEKIMVACNDERVTDDFLFMNDDHFLLKDYESAKFPYYYDGHLLGKITVTDYKHTVQNTLTLIGNVPYTDIHCPIVYNKKSFKALSRHDWSVQFGYCIKTLYCHKYVSINSMIEISDCKQDEKPKNIEGRPWFSIGDKAFYWDVRAKLQELYSHKSKYE